jgi:CheY-like chemotaxis protein
MSPARPYHILLIEDNPGDVLLMREMLSDLQLNCRLTVLHDGEEAETLVNKCVRGELQDEFDLVLLDLQVPRLSGPEILRKLKSDPSMRKIPVIVLTSSGDADEVKEAYQLRANCYIRKPLDLDDFTRAIQSLVQFWFGVAKLPTRAAEYPRRYASGASY